jgi:hypothetical protein
LGTAVARRVELWDDALVLPPALAARATVLVLGDELLGLKLSGPHNDRWRTPGGRELAAVAARATVLVLGDELLGLKLSGPGKSAAPLEPQLGVQAPGGAGGCQVHCALV